MFNEWEGTDWAGSEPVQTRASAYSYPDFATQLAAIRANHTSAYSPWLPPSIKDAIGVPAIFRAASLIANTVGMLSLQAYRNGRRLPDDERPRIIVRPDPFRIPRDFLRDTAWNMATAGEGWWWVAARDGDGQALSLINVPPREVRVEEDPDDLRYPKIWWRDKLMPRGDMVQITYLKESHELRGFGPLQACGAAVSVAVEAQEWAANFFASGGYPALGLQMDYPISKDEADTLREQWMAVPPNQPRFYGNDVAEVKEFGVNQSAAQMLQSRDYSNGDAARMFGMPGSLLDFNQGGSSLTYQNLETEMAKLLRVCVIPNYLEPIEQHMSDLLTRSTVTRFNVDAVNRADIKTRYEVYEIGIRSKVLTPERAQEMEGLLTGDVENAPMPLSMPQAIPASIPARAAVVEATRLHLQPQEVADVRCDGKARKRLGGIVQLVECGKLLSTTGRFEGRCPRCKKQYEAA